MLAAVNEWRRPIVAAVAVIAFAVLPLDRDLGVVLATGLGVSVVIAFIPIAINTHREILEAEHPIRVAVRNSVSMATLLVVAFSTEYYLLGVEFDQMEGLATKIDAVYFTVVTAATVGFGDITPTGQVARVLVVLNIVVTLAIVGIAFRIIAAATRQRAKLDERP
jgi:voltage-gated potassium channel